MLTRQDNDFCLVLDYVLNHVQQMLKQPVGIIRYPFIDPGSVYDGNVWDWDTFWSVYGLFSLWDYFDDAMRKKILLHAEGNVRNFFDKQLEDGYIPMMIENNTRGEKETYLNARHRQGVRMNMHKPFFAGQILMICRKKDDWEWACTFSQGLLAYMDCYKTYFHQRSGLYVWHDDIMIGMDNDPASFGRPHDSTANIFLNAFMVCELRALAELFEHWGMEEQASVYHSEEKSLTEAINRECWDPRDGYYYSVDVDVETRKYDWFHQGLGVFWRTLPIRIRVWSGAIPLLAGIADPEQARQVRNAVTDPSVFRTEYGVCTLDRRERMFDLRATNNPSNWLGPIWLVSNYAVSKGLRNYGYTQEAARIAEGSVRLLAGDLRESGCFHEYYDPFTGKPVMNGGFINWNILALTMALESMEKNQV